MYEDVILKKEKRKMLLIKKKHFHKRIKSISKRNNCFVFVFITAYNVEYLILFWITDKLCWISPTKMMLINSFSLIGNFYVYSRLDFIDHSPTHTGAIGGSLQSRDKVNSPQTFTLQWRNQVQVYNATSIKN